MPPVERWITLCVGFLVGAALGWLLGRRRSRADGNPQLEAELRELAASRERELQLIRAELTQAVSARAAAETGRAAAVELGSQHRIAADAQLAETASLRAEFGSLQASHATVRAELEATRARLAEQQRFHEERDRALQDHHALLMQELRLGHERALGELRDAFKALSSETIRDSAPEFLRLAGETLGRMQEAARGDLATREARIETLVKPLEEQLRSYQQRLHQADAQQAGALGEIRKQLESLSLHSQNLSNETLRLRMVLHSAPARGRWGEETLRRVVEAAGLSGHCDFVEQAREGESRPDLIVRLPGERVIVVDSKVPDLDFLNALQTADETRRAEALAAHALKLRATIKALADRDYPRQFANALDHVVLFLPAESLFSAALEGDRDLIVWAAERRILLATPASLIALLRSVAISWQQHGQSVNAREIAASAQELYARVTTFLGHFERLRKGLASSCEAFDAALGSYDRSVRPSGERLVKLGASSAGSFPEIPPVGTSLRRPPEIG